MQNFFVLDHASKKSRARAGRITTSHGVVHTPFFMPIATRGAVKHVAPAELKALGAEIILSNTYHLFLQPGTETLDTIGGLHPLMGWDRALLTDSGGYQVFSLGEKAQSRVISTERLLAGRQGASGEISRLALLARDDRKKLLESITDDGATFRSPLDGARHLFTPERVIDIEWSIGSDIMMVLDECVGNPCPKDRALKAMERTHAWALRCLKRMEERRAAQDDKKYFLFAINQGGTHLDLRKQSARFLSQHSFDGFAIGGLAVGEPRAVMMKTIDAVAPLLPKDKPRYLMGVGEPEELVAAVKRGVDMFDCVIPTRNARHGRLYVWRRDWREALRRGRPFYDRVQVTKGQYARDMSPLDPLSTALTSRQTSRAYLRHCLKTNEGLGYRLASINNLAFYISLMQRLRMLILDGAL